jgi:flagellar hook-associated protein 3 FlgL
MSSSIGSTGSNYSLLNTLIANSTAVHHQLDTLTEQVSSGLVSQTYAGLGVGAGVSLNLNPQLMALQTYQSNIDQAAGAMQVTQTAMSQIQQIAATFSADIPNLNGLSSTEVDSIASSARQALAQVANLLNTQDGNNYVFGGQDTGNPPVPSGDNILSSNFYTQINAAVTGAAGVPGVGLLGGASGATVAAATLLIAKSNVTDTGLGTGTSPFSAYLSQPPPGPGSTISAAVVQTGEGGTVQTGLLASANSVAVSPGTGSAPPTSTGSYMRDLMRALATLGSLSSSQINMPGFGALVQDTGTSLNGVVTAMAVDVGVLGNTQANLTKTQTQLSDTATAVSGQLSSVQEVDMATALSQLTATQTQLQASYRLITGANSLSLVNFLPSG